MKNKNNKKQHMNELATSHQNVTGSKAAKKKQKHAKETLDGHQELYRMLFEHAGEAIFILEAEGEQAGRIVSANKAAADMYGYTTEELLSLNIEDLYTPDRAREVPNVFNRMLNNEWIRKELVHRKKDGILLQIEISAGLLSSGNHKYILVFARNITKRKQIQDALQLSRERFRNLVETTVDWVWETDQQGNYTYASPQIQNLLGYTPEEVIGKKPFDLMPPDEAERISEIFKSILTNKSPLRNFVNVNRHKDGRLVVLETSGVPFFDSHGDFKGYRGIDRDITERKHTEENLNTSLREKETLLRELYHRTKNNMQVISNLIDLQAAYDSDKHMLELSREIQNRIKAMALVHEKLYQSRDLSNIDAKDYIADLASAMLESYQLHATRISLKLDLESVPLSLDSATPCGLIINELISNSLKHAFLGNQQGEIRIALHHTEKGEIELRFSDSGIGLPKDFNLGNTKSLGLTLVKNLSEKQLRGTIAIISNDPTEFLITFKEPIYLKRV